MNDTCTFCDARPSGKQCHAQHKERGYGCTRKRGHTGDHVACGIMTHNIFSWKQKTIKKDKKK